MLNKIKQIEPFEYIGNSLLTINNNTSILDNNISQLRDISTTLIKDINKVSTAVTEFENIFRNKQAQSIFNARLSAHKQYALTNAQLVGNSLIDVQTLYLHSYKGNSVGLYNKVNQRWELFNISTIREISLRGLIEGMYDIYMYCDDFKYTLNDFDLKFELVRWNNNTPPPKAFNQGVLSQQGQENNHKRYIGTVMLIAEGTTEVTYTSSTYSNRPIRNLLFNYYNQEETILQYTEQEKNYTVTVPLDKTGEVFKLLNNKARFWNTLNNSNVLSNKNTPIHIVTGPNCLVHAVYSTVVSVDNSNASISLSVNNDDMPNRGEVLNSTVHHVNTIGTYALESILRTELNEGLNIIRAFDAGDKKTTFNVHQDQGGAVQVKITN
jgi:hypothetical protein